MSWQYGIWCGKWRVCGLIALGMAWGGVGLPSPGPLGTQTGTPCLLPLQFVRKAQGGAGGKAVLGDRPPPHHSAGTATGPLVLFSHEEEKGQRRSATLGPPTAPPAERGSESPGLPDGPPPGPEAASHLPPDPGVLWPDTRCCGHAGRGPRGQRAGCCRGRELQRG